MVIDQFINYIIRCYVPELIADETKILNTSIFREAFTHYSFSKNHKNYERLEFLGDAVFHVIITEYLFKRYDEENEGFLTKLRIRIERGESMTELTKILDLGKYIQIYDVQINNKILEDVFEAFIGAFYINFGMKYAKQLIISLIERHNNLAEMILYDDNYKDLLLRFFHQMKWGHPIYHNSPHEMNKFISVVNSPTEELGRGISSSGNKAEQLASKNALVKLKVIVDGEIDQDWLDKINKHDKNDKNDKNKKDKNSISTYNSKNKLIRVADIKNLLLQYNVAVPKGIVININYFHEATTHKSYLLKNKLTKEDKQASKGSVKLQNKSNERLKFFGDAVIHFIISEYLYHKYSKADEGFLTNLRCKLENGDRLYYLAIKTGISSYILVSQLIEKLHGRQSINIFGAGFEAFIGALLLELGMFTTKQFLLEVIRNELNISVIAETETNYKELIQTLFVKNQWGKPVYKVIKETGPDHSKIFIIGVYKNDTRMGVGKANSKSKAEQLAAKEMYADAMNIEFDNKNIDNDKDKVK